MRRKFSRPVKNEMLTRATNAKGEICCEGCGLVLTGKVYEFDHIVAEELIPDWKKTDPLTADDGKVLGKDCCHRPAEGGKTRKDVAQIAKAKRQRDKNNGITRPTKKIQSREFEISEKTKRRQKSAESKRPLSQIGPSAMARRFR